MNTYLSIDQKFKRMLTNILSIFVILAVASPVTGNASAQEPFLPEGWHDGAEGTLDAAGCGVFGWAVDPDDRDRDLPVQILADGSPVATATANLLREDVEACTGGTCGFGVDLWGLISAGVEHTITAQAYDQETQSWVDLSGTPKTITCWGTPEGFHDGIEGVVDANSCTASGWVADPDDRSRDLQVRILADGDIVAETVADALRPDVSACTGGTCGFGVDLWGLISPNEEHQILAQAYDEETEAWMDLEATPKLLTCETPPPPNPFIAASLTDHWISLSYFSPDTPVIISIYKSEGPSKPVVELSRSTDASGNLFIQAREHNWDLEPGNLVTATDGVITKELLLEYLTLDVFDPDNDLVSGIALAGRQVGVGVGNANGEQWLTVYADDVTGVWAADFKTIDFNITADMWAGGHVNDEDGDVTAAHNTGAPEPQFVVFPEWEWFDGNNWPDGATVTITVKSKPECKVEKESWGGFFNGSFGESCDIVVGDRVKFTDGKTSLTHVVRNLAISAVDPVEDTITGTADPGTLVYVWPHDGWFEPFQASADANGVWQVDLGDVGYDLHEGSSGRSEIRDDLGNATAVDWYVPIPRFVVFPETEWFDGHDWPDGATVNITVESKPDCSVTKESWGGFFNGSFGEGCNLEIGDLVTFTDGTTTRTHTVRTLAITAVDTSQDTITGIADSGTTVYVWPHDGWFEPLQAIVNSSGMWEGDLASVGYDIQEGTAGRSEIRDDVGNATAVDWYAPNPRFTIFPLWQWYDGLDWPDGAAVNITVTGKPACNVTKTSWNYFFNGGFSPACYVGIGDTITFDDGTTTRTHVVHNLAITDIDLDKDTIRGTADAGTTVYVWPHDGWFEPLQVIANNSGSWQVDLGDVGYDIVEGSSGRAEIRDDMGNATAVDWNLNARIVVQITDDWFRAEGFAPNTSLKFSIYNAPGGKRLLKSATAQTDSGGTITHWVGDHIDLAPGNYLVVTDGKKTKEIMLEALTFDVFDTTVGILLGTAPEPFGRTVSVGIGCWQRDDLTMDTTTDENGAWIVDFHTFVPNDFGCVFAWIYDADGDISEVRPVQIIGMNE